MRNIFEYSKKNNNIQGSIGMMIWEKYFYRKAEQVNRCKWTNVFVEWNTNNIIPILFQVKMLRLMFETHHEWQTTSLNVNSN